MIARERVPYMRGSDEYRDGSFAKAHRIWVGVNWVWYDTAMAPPHWWSMDDFPAWARYESQRIAENIEARNERSKRAEHWERVKVQAGL